MLEVIMDEPTLSVIIPVYNAEKYLCECLDGVVGQTYSSLEIICVNDGSTDGSLEILRRYEALDSRVKVIDKPNGGVSSARNAGLDIACGKYVGFVDSDDMPLPEMYDFLMRAAIENEADYICCDFLEFSDKAPVDIKYDYSCYESGLCDLFRFSGPAAISAASLCCKVIDRKLFNDVRFPLDTPYAEDFWVSSRTAEKASNIFRVPLSLYLYRRNPSSATSSGFKLEKLKEFKVYAESYRLFKSSAPDIAAFCADRIIRSAAWLKKEAKSSEHYAQARKICASYARKFALKYLFNRLVPLKLKFSRLALYYLPFMYDFIMKHAGN